VIGLNIDSDNNSDNANTDDKMENDATKNTDGQAGNNIAENTDDQTGNNIAENTDGQVGNNITENTDGQVGNNITENTDGQAGNNITENVNEQSENKPAKELSNAEANVIDSNMMRKLLWKKSVDYIKKNPIFGKPSNDIEIEMYFYGREDAVKIIQSPHNFVLEIWLALGLPGLIIYFIIIAKEILVVSKSNLSKNKKYNFLLALIVILGFSFFQPLFTSYFVIAILFFLNIYIYEEEIV
jgi:hypothetical protein